jgi:DNA-binding LytR/AlgR family response regulator
VRNQNAESQPELKVLVVDDERLARERLERLLERIDGVTCVGDAENGHVALAKIATLLPDVVLLDIEMPGLDGLELAATPGIPPVIFTTAHVHFAADAFDLDAVDFLPKPVRAERLIRALDRARRRTDGASPSRSPARQIAVHEAGTVRFVDPANVVAFYARDKYTEFKLDGRELLVRESLDGLEARLGDAGFVRTHRSALVRRDAIQQLVTRDGDLLAKLEDGSSVEVSRRLAPNLRRVLGVRK